MSQISLMLHHWYGIIQLETPTSLSRDEESEAAEQRYIYIIYVLFSSMEIMVQAQHTDIIQIMTLRIINIILFFLFSKLTIEPCS